MFLRTALSQEFAKLRVPWLSPGELLQLDQVIQALEADDFHPLLRKMPLQEHHLQRVTAWTIRSDPHQLLTLLLLYIGHDGLLRTGEITSDYDDSSRALVVSGQARHGNTVLQIQDVSDGPGVPSPVSRPTDSQRSIPHAGVVGHDGAPSLDDGMPFSQEALRHSL